MTSRRSCTCWSIPRAIASASAPERSAAAALAAAEAPQRLAELRRRAGAAELDALIVSEPVSIEYLTGFPRDAFALILVAAQWAALVTVAGFAAEAEPARALYDVEIVPHGSWGRAAQMLSQRLPAGAQLGFQSEYLPHAMFNMLAGAVQGPELVDGDGPLAGLRAVKSSAELQLMRTAAAPLPETFEWLSRQRLAGRSERQVAISIRRHLEDEHGVDGLAFETVVAAGAHGAIPHHTASGAEIAAGQLLVVDMGAVVGGYRSDMTRTLAVGRVDLAATEVHELVRRAQQQALSAVAPGAAAQAVHGAAAEVIDAAGHGERFLHGVGHGVGLDLHEPPYLDVGVEEPLSLSQVVTVEPGVYLPGRFGVRIEDELVVADGGYEALTSFPTELITCG